VEPLETLLGILSVAYDELLETLPYLILGVVVGGFVAEFFPTDLVSKRLRKASFKSLLGCSCCAAFSPTDAWSSIPVTAGLSKGGLLWPLAAVFWMAAAITGPVEIMMTGGLLGLNYLAAFWISAILIGVFAGFAFDYFTKRGLIEEPFKDKARRMISPADMGFARSDLRLRIAAEEGIDDSELKNALLSLVKALSQECLREGAALIGHIRAQFDSRSGLVSADLTDPERTPDMQGTLEGKSKTGLLTVILSAKGLSDRQMKRITIRVLSEVMKKSHLRTVLDQLYLNWTGFRVLSAFKTSLKFFYMASKYLILGILVAGIIEVLIPEELITELMGSQALFLSVLVSVLIAVPMCGCQGGGAIVASELLSKGAAPGAVLSYAIVAPATCVTSLAMAWGQFGWKNMVLYTLILAFGGYLAGIAFNFLLLV